MKKCWQIRNEINSEAAEILLYGPISDETWWGDETTPKQLADDLVALGGKDVVVRINSGGGDVFAAHAIYNQLEHYTGNVTIRIDGLAASAATIVAMAGNKTVTSTNGVLMIHNPALGLFGYYTANDFEKMKNDLGVIKNSIIAAYKKKCKVDDKTLAKLMDDETYMNADEALAYGFIDAIDGEKADIALNGNYLVVNSIKHDINIIRSKEKLKNIVNHEKGEKGMDVVAELRKILGIDGVQVQNAAQNPPTQSVEDAVKNERERILALDALRDGNKAIDAIVSEAKNTGKTVTEIKVYIDAIKANAPVEQPANNENQVALQAIATLIKDNQASGVEGIKSDPKDPQASEEKELADATNYMAQYINKRNGVHTDGRTN